MKVTTNYLVGLGLAIFGFILIVLSAVDYLVGLSVETSGLSGIGLVCVVMGMYFANKGKK